MNLLRLGKNNEYFHTLSKIRQVIPSAIIAGGAIRDLYHNKSISDVDIYVPQGKYSEGFWKHLLELKLNDTDYVSQPGKDSEHYEILNHIDAVWEIQKSGTLYNIITVDLEPIEYVLRYFNIGLCKAYCDGTKIRLTADFIHDSRTKQLTIVAEDMSQDEFNHMMNYHIVKLQIKYPEYSLIIPVNYIKLYDEYKDNL